MMIMMWEHDAGCEEEGKKEKIHQTAVSEARTARACEAREPVRAARVEGVVTKV